MKRIVWLMIMLFFCFSANIFAEIITLKSGQKIEGKILEQTNKYVKIDTGVGVDLTYYADEIASIDTKPGYVSLRYDMVVPPGRTEPCPQNVAGIKQEDAETIVSCPALHKELCKEVCGARYDDTTLMNFDRTGGKPGLLCQDLSTDDMKNGVAFADDQSRKECMEQDTSIYHWCSSENKTINGVNLGSFVQCHGKMP